MDPALWGSRKQCSRWKGGEERLLSVGGRMYLLRIDRASFLLLCVGKSESPLQSKIGGGRELAQPCLLLSLGNAMKREVPSIMKSC